MKPEFLADLIDRFFDAAIAPFADRLAVIEARPAPQDGKSVALEDVRPLVAELVEDRMRTLPPPKDGEPGKSVTVGEVVEALEPRIEAAIARAVLDVERRAQGVLERAVERMPRPADGNDGADGIPFESLEFVQENERSGYWIGRNGDRERRWPVKLAAIVYRGIWNVDTPYEVGDVVTFGGSSWIARTESASVKPGGDEAVWQLMVKRGRDLTK